MTRPSTGPRGTVDAFTAGMRRAGVPEIRREERTVAGAVKSDRPGFTKWRVRQMVDGKRRTRAEAAQTFAHQPWARRAEDAGASGGWYVWFVPEEAMR